MKFESSEQVIAFIKKHQSVEKWVADARKNSTILKALIDGTDFQKVLIQKIEKIESDNRAVARIKYSKDIRDMFSRIMQPRINVFSASGGSVTDDFKSDKQREKFYKSTYNFKGQKSLYEYLKEDYFRLFDTDPNGVIFVEYVEDEDIYPTYKSINDIRTYKSNGQLCEYILFEPKHTHRNGQLVTEWRLVDDETDWRIDTTNGSDFRINEELTFPHPFGVVPATILSSIQTTGSEIRLSTINSVIELAKDYARDKSILTIYKFQNGFPKHGKYEAYCRSCHGTGKNGEDSCKSCNGKGISRINDVTDTTILDIPRNTDTPTIAPNTEWFVSPDLATWTQYKTDLRDMEDLIDATIWGTRRVTAATNETATGRFIDSQPVMNKLSSYSNVVQWTHNQLAYLVENWVNGQPVVKSEYYYDYGHRFIIESPDVILENYTKARKEGDNNTILDKLLDEYLLARYQNSLQQLEIAQKKRMVEPYVHQTIKEVNDYYGKFESYKKVQFVSYWEQVDTKQSVEQLEKGFDKYVTDNPLEVPAEPTTIE